MTYVHKSLVLGGVLATLLAFGVASPATSNASCTQVVREDVWYVGTSDTNNVLNERLYDAIDCSVWASENGVAYWNESVTHRPMEYDPYETVCIGIINPTGDIAKPPFSNSILTGPQQVETTYRSGNTCPAQTVSASLVANPNSIIRGEQSLLTWASTGATACTGNGFSTGGATSGSVNVSPQQTTNYTVTCTGLGGHATASAQVTVADGSLQVSCRAHPGQAGIGEDVLWSSTVSGPQGTYTYAWSGTDGLSGTLSQVFKQYQTTGTKTGSLAVSVVPTQNSSGGQCSSSTGTPWINYGGASCSGGAVVGSQMETEDGVALPERTNAWVAERCVESGALAGDCCEYTQMNHSQTVGTGNSYWGIRVVRGGTLSTAEPSYPIGGTACQSTHECSSVSGLVTYQCSGGQSGTSGSQVSKTVVCENSVTIGAGGSGGSQCSDGIDNDGDGKVDLADQGCSGSGDDSEATTSSATAQCSDGIDNNGDGNIDYPEDPGCASASDVLELLEPGSLTLTASPPLIKKNQSCTLTLSAAHVTSCTLAGSGVSRSYTAQNGSISLKEVVTPALAQTSTYTLSCNGLDGKTVTKSVDCKIAPTFQEI